MLASFATKASAQVTQSEIVFIVDESGSMAGEQAFLPTFVTDLDVRLSSQGVTGTYGLTGFGRSAAAGQLGRKITVGSGDFGTAAAFGTAVGDLETSGSFEDGFSAMNFVLNNYIASAPGARRTFVLVTDEERANGNNSLTAQSILADLNAAGINLVVVVDAAITGTGGTEINALAANSTTAFFQDGTSFTTEALGEANSFEGSTRVDYIDTALATPNGCVADLNQLRQGGDTATAFAEVFAQCLITAATGNLAALPPGVNNLFLNVYVNSTSAVQSAVDQQVSQILEIDLGAEILQNALASASDDTQIIEDLFNVEGLRAFLVFTYMDGSFDAHGNNKAFSYSGGGGTAGVDYTMKNVIGLDEQLTIGVAAGYHTLDSSVSNPLGSLDTDTYSGQLYAAVKMPDGVYVKADAQIALSNYEQRRISGGTVFGGSTNGFSFSVDAEVGYEFQPIVLDQSEPGLKLHLTPFAGVGFENRNVDGFQETNGGLLIGDFHQSALLGRFGGRATLSYDMDLETKLFLTGRLAALVDVTDDDSTALINNGTQPTERIEAVDDLTLQAGLTAGAKIGSSASLFVSYGGGFSSNATQHAISAGGVLNF
ncbi:MAG: autotransporter domain-containing protein [Pseudomonadota bacterium]